MDHTEFVLHVSDMSKIINVEASRPSLGGWAKTIFDLGVKQMFHAAPPRQDLIFLIDSRMQIRRFAYVGLTQLRIVKRIVH